MSPLPCWGHRFVASVIGLIPEERFVGVLMWGGRHQRTLRRHSIVANVVGCLCVVVVKLFCKTPRASRLPNGRKHLVGWLAGWLDVNSVVCIRLARDWLSLVEQKFAPRRFVHFGDYFWPQPMGLSTSTTGGTSCNVVELIPRCVHTVRVAMSRGRVASCLGSLLEFIE